MPDEETQARVDLKYGDNHLRIEGPKEFVERQMDTVLEQIPLKNSSKANGNSQTEAHVPPTQAPLDAEYDSHEEEPESPDDDLKLVADELSVDYEKLSEEFYVDEDGPGVRNPRQIDPEYALLGFCTIQKVLDGQTVFDNLGMKERLMEDEMVPIDRWGSSLLYNLRRKGLLKNDPKSDKSRNQPFKITPDGIAQFAEWIEEKETE